MYMNPVSALTRGAVFAGGADVDGGGPEEHPKSTNATSPCNPMPT
jgi:hypothetical protein